MEAAYKRIRKWTKLGVHFQVMAALRAAAAEPISPRANLFMVVFRAAFPDLSPSLIKRWAGVVESSYGDDIPARGFRNDLEENGGMKGLLRMLPDVRRDRKERLDWLES